MENVCLVVGLMLLFGGWFCLFAKDLLPAYYDNNKIDYVSQGIFRIHIAGLSFHNGNWPYICTTLKVCTLATAVLYPLAGILMIYVFSMEWWNHIQNILLAIVLGGMLISTYIVGKKYE